MAKKPQKKQQKKNNINREYVLFGLIVGVLIVALSMFTSNTNDNPDQLPDNVSLNETSDESNELLQKIENLSKESKIDYADELLTYDVEGAKMVCESFNDQDDIDDCYIDIISEREEIAYCDFIQGSTRRDICYSNFIDIGDELSDDYYFIDGECWCDKFDEQYLEDACYSFKEAQEAFYD